DAARRRRRPGEGIHMRVLITGATGFVGSHTTAAALGAGHRVRVMVRDADKAARVLASHGIGPEDVEVAVADMTDREAVSAAVAGCEAVIHTAAQIGVSAEVQAGHDTEVNAHGLRVVLEAAEAGRCDPVVHTSSTSAYWPVAGERLRPDSPLGSLDGAYCRSKRACEALIRDRQQHGVPATTLVLGAVYGPDAPALDGSGDSVKAMLESMMLVTDGGVGVVDVRDVAALLVATLEPGRGPRHLLAGGTFLDWPGFVAAVEQAADRDIPVVEMEPAAVIDMGRGLDERRAAGDPVDIALSEEAARIMVASRPTDDDAWAALGIRPRPAAETLASMIGWLIDAGHLDPDLAPGVRPA
ncbi:MAG: NAD-dependent epimerase/dehydratase family protein, partial [Actinomycetota bacterium]